MRPADLPARLFWCDPGRVLVPGVLDLTTDDAVGTQRVPAMAQGAVWADLGPYQQQGGRPVVPMLARFDVRDGIDRWARQDCRPDSPS